MAKISYYPDGTLIADTDLFIVERVDGNNYTFTGAELKAQLGGGSPGKDGLTVFAKDGDDGLDAFPVPGERGTTGLTGNTGADGAVLLLTGDAGDDAQVIPGVDGKAGQDGLVIFLPAQDGEDAIYPLPGNDGSAGVQGARGQAAISPIFGQVSTNIARPKRAGTLYLEPVNGFPQNQIGKPVFVQQAPSSNDEEECVQLHCVGEIFNSRQLRIRWMSIQNRLVRGKKTFNYLIPA
jgi:hypothetical protein